MYGHIKYTVLSGYRHFAVVAFYTGSYILQSIAMDLSRFWLSVQIVWILYLIEQQVILLIEAD